MVLLAALLAAPAYTPACMHAADTTGPGQGIEGIVYIVSGNHMPAKGMKTAPPNGAPGITVCIFEQTHISQVSRIGQSAWYSAVHTKLLQETITDSTGSFRLQLPAGHYSIFTKRKGMYYANRFDTNNNIAPVEVFPEKITRVECRMEGDRKAVY